MDTAPSTGEFPQAPLELDERPTGTVHRRIEQFPRALRRGRFALVDALTAGLDDVTTLCAAPEVTDLDGALFLDTETTGLRGGAGTFVFLLGTASFEPGGFEVRQWVLPDPSHEPAWLDAVEEEAGRAKVLVSYHGRGFDVPRLEERFLLHGRKSPFEGLPHLDLLTGARRVFKLRTRRVALSRLEERVLGAPRVDDLPGAECPAAWYAYLRQEVEPMARVLEHNLLDLLSLPAVLAALAEAAAGEAPAPDLFSAGRVFAKSGRDVRALGLHRRAADSARDDALRAAAHEHAARLLRRCGDWDAEGAALLAATRADPLRATAWLALAKHAEHRAKDFDVALSCCDQLAELAARSTLPKRVVGDLARRRERVLRKRSR